MTLFIYCTNSYISERMRDWCEVRRETDSGIDVMTGMINLDFSSKTYGVRMGLGIHCAALDADGNPAPYLLLARSSMSLTPLRMSNQIGLADAGYRGELIARVDCVDRNIITYKVEEGIRLFQIVQHNWLPWGRVHIVDSLADLPAAPDNRGEGGFGSTGK